ncbi:MAG: hypothetical protein NT004_06360 [Bacteroidetes bacterium]|nr:hypothetical protein [Bacteroidota bacterium]
MSKNKLIRFDWAMKTTLRDKANFDVLEGFLAALLIVEHQKPGDDFRNISKVISISIMYFNLGFGDDYIY